MTDLIPANDHFDILPSAIQLAERIAPTEFVPTALRNRPEAVLAAILTGNELGLAPMTSLSKIHVIEGRPSLAAEAMRAIVQSAGHQIWLEESNNTRATVGGLRAGSDKASYVTWTLDDADKANLKGKNNWKRYPRAMLVARATGELCRFLFADALAGISYTTEEVEDGFTLEDEGQEPAEPEVGGRPEGAAPPKPKTSKRKVEKKAPPPPPAAAAAPVPPLPGEEGYDDLAGVVAPEGAIDTTATEVDGPSPKSRFWAQLREMGADGDEGRPLRHAVIHMATSGATDNSQEAEPDALDAACELLTQVAEGTWTVADERLVLVDDEAPTFAWGETHGPGSASNGWPAGWKSRAGAEKARATKAARAFDDTVTSFDDIGPELAHQVVEQGA